MPEHDDTLTEFLEAHQDLVAARERTAHQYAPRLHDQMIAEARFMTAAEKHAATINEAIESSHTPASK